ncbi:leucine-rich repeat protein [Skeletonema marinoi]|uniref:Leucine-rich repeat protein n=1 Tax=Skeletonema marinoi TaxID=267567 RepID=A0AAD9D554_9STRA|nr:leucine-rich repeat protein [Skeletonema marinoi]
MQNSSAVPSSFQLKEHYSPHFSEAWTTLLYQEASAAAAAAACYNITDVTMNQRYNHYYEENEATINLDEITSWRESTRKWAGWDISLAKAKGDSGKLVPSSIIDGIARNQSIRTLDVNTVKTGGLSDEEYSVIIAEALINLSQLEVLHLWRSNYHCCSALGKVMSSGTTKLKELRLFGAIGDIGVASLENGFATIGPFLKTLDLGCNSIGNDGLMTVVLDLSENDFSLAAAGLGSLSDWLQRKQTNLKELDLFECGINDDGLQAFAEGVANNCEELRLSINDSITATGLSHLSRVLLSARCRLQRLSLNGMDFGDDGAKALGVGLAGNQSLRCLHFDNADTNLTVRGWSAFSTVLCDTSSINNTYLSNHYVGELYDDYEDDDDIIDESRVLVYSRLNEQHPQYAAKCKILMSHPHLDMKTFLRCDLKFLPLAIAWFERAKPCTTLTIRESDEAFQSRELTAMYEFVRERSTDVLERREALISEAWKDQITMAKEETKRLAKDKESLLKDYNRLRENIEQRGEKIAQLEEENRRLAGLLSR